MKKRPRKSTYFVYIVECQSGTYYTGYTNNLKNRINKHNAGTGSKFLRGKGPVKLVFVKQYIYLKCALREELRIKKLSRLQKSNLIKNNKKETKKIEKTLK